MSESSPKVRVRISDLLGKSLGKMEVVIESAMRQTDGAVILANSKMAQASEEGLFEIDMLAAKPGNTGCFKQNKFFNLMIKRPMLMMGFVIRDLIIAGQKVRYLKASGAAFVKHIR